MNPVSAPVAVLPRLLRLQDVVAYLGMDRNRFSAEAGPIITAVPIGRQDVAFVE